MRLRILFGTLALVFGLTLYGLAIMSLGVRVLPNHWAAEIPFYVVTGLVWIWPAAKLVRWMAEAAPYRPPPGS